MHSWNIVNKNKKTGSLMANWIGKRVALSNSNLFYGRQSKEDMQPGNATKIGFQSIIIYTPILVSVWWIK